MVAAGALRHWYFFEPVNFLNTNELTMSVPLHLPLGVVLDLSDKQDYSVVKVIWDDPVNIASLFQSLGRGHLSSGKHPVEIL